MRSGEGGDELGVKKSHKYGGKNMMSLNNTEDNEEKIVDLENMKIIKTRVWKELSMKQ